MEPIDELRTELAATVEKSKRRAAANYRYAYMCLLLAVIASGAATYLVATDGFSRQFVAAITATPALCLLVNHVFRFDQKLLWWRSRQRAIETLQRALKYEGGEVDKVSRRLSRCLEELELSYPRFGVNVFDRTDSSAARTTPIPGRRMAEDEAE